MKTFLTIVCLGVLSVMLYVTVSASLHQDVLTATRLLWPDPWFRATLADAYFGFLFFWLWVAWREQSALQGAVWFVLIMALGNFAMAGYLMLQLRRLRPGDSIETMLLRSKDQQP
jgi:predicted permease